MNNIFFGQKYGKYIFE